MRVIFHREANLELIESAQFYESRTEGLGSDFLRAVETAIDRIRRSPGVGYTETPTVQRRLVRGFPFTILYEIHPDRIYIAAIMHQHRKPRYWRDRVE